MDFLDQLREQKVAIKQLTPEEVDPSLMVEFVKGPFIDNGNGTYDCIFIHPQFGEIPFTAGANDPEAHGRAAFAYILTQLPSGGEGD